MAAMALLIERAKEETGLTESRIAKRIKVHPNTLSRWKTEICRSYDLEALIELCVLGKSSMDSAFGLGATEPSPGWADALQRRLEALELRMSERDTKLASILSGSIVPPDEVSSDNVDRLQKVLDGLTPRQTPAKKRVG